MVSYKPRYHAWQHGQLQQTEGRQEQTEGQLNRSSCSRRGGLQGAPATMSLPHISALDANTSKKKTVSTFSPLVFFGSRFDDYNLRASTILSWDHCHRAMVVIV